MLKMKALYVNHNDETFAELTHGKRLIYSLEWIALKSTETM